MLSESIYTYAFMLVLTLTLGFCYKASWKFHITTVTLFAAVTAVNLLNIQLPGIPVITVYFALLAGTVGIGIYHQMPWWYFAACCSLPLFLIIRNISGADNLPLANAICFSGIALLVTQLGTVYATPDPWYFVLQNAFLVMVAMFGEPADMGTIDPEVSESANSIFRIGSQNALHYILFFIGGGLLAYLLVSRRKNKAHDES